jgi:hypothetical protein
VFLSEGSTLHENPRFSSLPLDWCYTWATDCGAPPAHKFCEYNEGFGWVAQGFSKLDSVPPTKLIGSGEVCNQPGCGSFEYIQCVDTRRTTPEPMFKGYRLDFCRFWGSSCGQPAADAYCRNTHGSDWYGLSWTQEPDVGPTRVIANSLVCDAPGCDGFAEITCAYEPYMQDVPNDIDSDTVEDQADNCPGTPNPMQENADGDSVGDACDPFPMEAARCSDGVDNDGDGLVDESEPGCSSALDTFEWSFELPCDDGSDNDGDGLVDYPADPSCTSLEGDEVGTTQCDDGLDNDGDGAIDLDDSHCSGPGDDREAGSSSRCGLGFEQIVLLPALMSLRRRRNSV